MNNSLLAYAAGIIDGEGSIIISKQVSRCICFILQVQVSMKEPSKVPEWLSNNFGGNYTSYTQHSKTWGYNSSMLRWTICGIKAQEFLTITRPFIIDKIEQIDIALNFPIASAGQPAEKDLQEAAFNLIRCVPGRKRSS